MEFKDLPKNWRGVDISLTKKQSVADVTDQYTIQFSRGKISGEVDFYAPKMEDNRFYMNGNKYVVWYRLCKPICSVEYVDNTQVFTLHNMLTRPDRPDNYDMKFYKHEGEVVCEFKGKRYSLTNTYLHDLFYSYWITNSDRKSLNEHIDSDNDSNYITEEDVNKIVSILKEYPEYTTNWKEIFSMRVIGLEDLIISVIMLALPDVLKNFYKGNIRGNVLTRNIRSFLATEAPEIRIDLNETDIGSYSQNNKVILPFDNYCDVNELVPDKSWFEYIDLLDAPQSIKVGSVAAFSDKVHIENRRIRASVSEMLEVYGVQHS